jgi:hypothetical protein
MRSFFNVSLTGIRSLVGDQAWQVEKETQKPPKVRNLIWAPPVSKLISPLAQKILLVGGLGGSPYIFSVLESLYPNRVLRPIRP